MYPLYPYQSDYGGGIDRKSFGASAPRIRVALYELHPDLTELLVKSIRHMMSLFLVRQAVAQIIDNVPIRGQYYGGNPDDFIPGICYNLPPRRDEELSISPTEEASILASQFRDSISLNELTLEAPVSKYSMLSLPS
jgi:hypothetical protein